MNSTKAPRRSTSKRNECIDLCSPSPPPKKYCSDESSYDSSIDDLDEESLYHDDTTIGSAADDSESEQEIGSDDSSVSSGASILDNNSLPDMRATVNEEHKHGNRSKHAKSTPSPWSPPSSSKENTPNFNKPNTKPKSPVKKVRSSPPPTKERYTKDQEKAVEDVLLASKNGNASHYKVLNLPANASNADIKKRYKKLALKLHPDKNRAPLAGEAFKVIGNAYDVLKSPTKKAAYDINITNDMSNSVPRPPPEQPSTSTSEYAPGTSIYNTIPTGTDVTLHNLNPVSSHLNGITGYVVSFQQGQYKIKRDHDPGFIDADPLALLQNINVLSRSTHKEVKVVSYRYGNVYIANLRGRIYCLCLDEFIIPNGTIVRLVVNSPEYNGKFGRIIGWTERSSDGADTSYYEVQLSLVKIIRVKMAHVRL